MKKQFIDKIKNVQNSLKLFGLEGWLLYDFRKTNDLACHFLAIPSSQMLTRRFFYWIPVRGTPLKLVHRIETHVLEHLPGDVLSYASWKELEECLMQIVGGCKKVAMEYSPRNAIPYVSKVDAGTIELIRSFGPDVVSSADLLQAYTSVWDKDQLESHLAAAHVLDSSVQKAWQYIASSLQKNQGVTERDVQNLLLNEFERHECVSEDRPICAVNEHSSNPHYTIEDSEDTVIKKGDFILIDLWCKKKASRAVYADITRVAVAASHPTKKQKEIFSIVKEARDAAMDLIVNRLAKREAIRGWEVDQACRQKIVQAGYSQFFTHRTGHNIGEKDHGDGAHIDNFETQDCRLLLPATCFSIEPGIYLPGEFGVRLEHDVYIEADGSKARITGGLQQDIVCLLS